MITFLLSISTSSIKLHFNHFHELTVCNQESPTCCFWHHAWAVISAAPENKAKVAGFFRMLTWWCYIWNTKWPSKLAPPTWEFTAWHETQIEDYTSHWNGLSGFTWVLKTRFVAFNQGCLTVLYKTCFKSLPNHCQVSHVWISFTDAVSSGYIFVLEHSIQITKLLAKAFKKQENPSLLWRTSTNPLLEAILMKWELWPKPLPFPSTPRLPEETWLAFLFSNSEAS